MYCEGLFLYIESVSDLCGIERKSYYYEGYRGENSLRGIPDHSDKRSYEA